MTVNRSLPQHASLEGRLRHYTKKPNANGCSLWKAGKDKDGYGLVRWDGRQHRVHRAWWTVHRGDPGRMMVCHTCDVRPCLTLEHLFLGSGKDNADDRDAKKRHAFGERNAAAKITEDVVRQIRAAKGTQMQIAAMFGLGQSQVSAIRRRERWAHVR